MTKSNLLDQRLLDWMLVFQDAELDNMGVCSLAYSHRHDHNMAVLRAKGLQDRPNANITDDSMSPYSGVQHYIGRLADHIRRPKRLVQHAACLQEIWDNPFTIRQAPAIPGVLVPAPDADTTLDKIAKRMLPTDDRRLGEYQAALQELDMRHAVLGRMARQYNGKPRRVHAEILVLEHFWAARRLFALGERFIGCSKPACYCCRRYIEGHPIGCFVPDSHENIYPGWSPPLLGADDPGFVDKRRVLQGVIDALRASALEQISQLSGRAARCHPDSVTGITRSVAAGGSVAGGGRTHFVSAGALQPPTAAGLAGAASPMLAFSEDDTEPDSDAFARLDLSSLPDSSNLGSPATSISSAPSSPSLYELEGESDDDSEDGGGVLLYGPGSRH